jgi:hypothetical protein
MIAPRTLEVTEVLDVSAARRLGDILTTLSAGERLLVDCRAVRSFEDRALAHLAVALRECPGRVELQGLGAHQWRMLGYLGLAKVGRAGGDEDGDEGRAVPVSR